jgi:hypothetical protein
MTKSQFSLLGTLFVAGALVAAGCGDSGGGGTGGAAGAGTGGRGGSGSGGTGTGGRGGAAGGGSGGAAGNGAGGRTDGGTTDSGAGGSATDAHPDTGPVDTNPCVTSFGAGNQVLYSFDSGYGNWFPEVQNLGYSFGFSPTEHASCPGALSMTVNYGSYGDPNSSASTTFGNTPANWSAFGKLHVSVKLVTTDYTAVNGIQTFINSSGYANYANSSVFLGGSTFSDGAFHEVVFDFAHPNGTLLLSVINKTGVQLLIKGAPAEGGIPTAAPVQMFVDDVWLEAAPPDAGPDVQPDAPAGDATTDATLPIDTGVDTTSG